MAQIFRAVVIYMTAGAMQQYGRTRSFYIRYTTPLMGVG